MAKSLLFLPLLLLAACATHFENYPLTLAERNTETRSIDVSRQDRPIILMAFSGGGSRAAALSWIILKELRGFEYGSGDRPRRLIDDVRLVSSVSGGSVTAAYFGLYGADGLDEFSLSFLERDNMRALELEAANPFTWLSFAVRGESRIAAIEALFDAQLFHGKTFAALNQPGKPFIVLNATDMASGEAFAFTPQRFDDICSDFDKQLISVGVAASAAFPVLASPVAFRNYSTTGCRDTPEPPWITERLGKRYGVYTNIEEFKRARYANDLRHGQNRFREINYLYFLDGGLADNLGIHSLIEAISSPHGTGAIINDLNAGRIRKLVVVIVNARSDPASSIYESPNRPGVIGMIQSVISVPVDSNSSGVGAQMSVLLEQLKQAGIGAPRDALFGGLKVYPINIDFDQLRANDPLQRELRDKAKAISTQWTITQDQRQVIEEVGTLLLHQHPCFQKLVLDLRIRNDFADPAVAETGCRDPVPAS